VYFIVEGRVKMLTSEGYIFRNFVEGSYFGDIEIMTGKVIAKSFLRYIGF
jgi:hypothetical protein